MLMFVQLCLCTSLQQRIHFNIPAALTEILKHFSVWALRTSPGVRGRGDLAAAAGEQAADAGSE